MSLLIVILFVFLTDFTTGNVLFDPVVETQNGLFRGKYHGHYYSFEGIPYAEPPVGERRFEPPMRYFQKHDGVQNATKLHESCMRYDPMETKGEIGPVLVGVEDCLYLNIYTPDIETYHLYPVMFYIHGGGFMFGSGDDLRENILMDRGEIILVTFNYRLGPLGFLSTGDTEISGNMGLKDQRLALKWIKDNIRSFNGNPEQILMSGFSAGGASVEFQLLSRGIENYVNAAISLSGSALGPWAVAKNPLQSTVKMANLMKCSKENDAENLSTKEIKECLKSVKAEDIVLAVNKFHYFYYNPIRVFGPVVESKAVKNPFISDYPANLIKKGHLSNVPWIASYTAEDGGIFISGLFNPNGKALAAFNENPRKYLPIILFYGETMNAKEMNEASEQLWKKYDLPDKFSLNDYDKLTGITTDLLLKNSILESIKLHGTYGPGNTYGYVYDNPARYGWGNYMANSSAEVFGAHHGDDVFLILDYPERDMSKYPFRKDEKMNSKKLVTMMVTYAKTSFPEFDGFRLPPVNKNNHMIVNITRNSHDLKQIDELVVY